jgi:hypothetical protein
MAESFGTFADRLARLEGQLSGAPLKRVMTAIGVEAKKIAERNASSDLGGDAKFSGWAPTLTTRFDHVDEGKILFSPTRRSAGPWTVAEFGRNSTAGPRMVGPRLTKTGRVSKARQKRWNGTTRGKGTATRVNARIDTHVDTAARNLFDKALKGFWK